MAEDFASTPDFDAHLASTRRERFRQGQAIDVPVTVAWGERSGSCLRRHVAVTSCPAMRASSPCPVVGTLPDVG